MLRTNKERMKGNCSMEAEVLCPTSSKISKRTYPIHIDAVGERGLNWREPTYCSFKKKKKKEEPKIPSGKYHLGRSMRGSYSKLDTRTTDTHTADSPVVDIFCSCGSLEASPASGPPPPLECSAERRGCGGCVDSFLSLGLPSFRFSFKYFT